MLVRMLGLRVDVHELVLVKSTLCSMWRCGMKMKMYNTYWMQDQDYSETFGYRAWVSPGLLECVLDGLVKVVA